MTLYHRLAQRYPVACAAQGLAVYADPVTKLLGGVPAVKAEYADATTDGRRVVVELGDIPGERGDRWVLTADQAMHLAARLTEAAWLVGDVSEGVEL